jgi:hypothetical protein
VLQSTHKVRLLSTTTLWVIRAHHLMMLDSSIALTFLSRWFVRSILTPSSLRLASRPVTVWSATHSFRLLSRTELLVLLQTVQLLLLILTSITEELRLPTLPDSQVTLSDPPKGVFFYGNK